MTPSNFRAVRGTGKGQDLNLRPPGQGPQAADGTAFDGDRSRGLNPPGPVSQRPL